MEEKDIVIDGQQEALLFHDACTIIDQAQAEAYRAVDITLIKRNWLLGMRINKDVLKEQRAEYGKQVVKNLSLSLIERYGRGFSMRNLYNFVDFYQSHPDIFHAVSGESEFTDILQSVTAKSLIKEKHLTNILQTLTAKSPIRLTWSHYAIILQESSKEARDWYEQEAAREMWGTRTLQRNVSSFVLIDLKTTKPKREDLRREIEQQKEFYRLQHKEDK